MHKKTLICLIIICGIAYRLPSLKIGYALSGGGARGFAHIGMLKVMEEAGLRPDYISGTSIGALIGGLYAMGYSAVEIESLFINTNWNSLFNDGYQRKDLYMGQKRWTPYGNASFRLDDSWKLQLPESVISGNKINLELFRIFSPASTVRDFNRLPIPFSAVTTDLISGKQQIFTSGSMMQGIRASMSIPSLMKPFSLNNTLYIDGGISQNLPGNQVKMMGADYVIGMKVNSTLRTEDRLNNIVDVLDQTINIGIINRVNEQISDCDLILEPELEEFSATGFKNIKPIIEAGEVYARSMMSRLKALSDSLSNEKKSTINERVPDLNRFKFMRIAVYGNNHLSAQVIRDYTGLHNNTYYTVSEIIQGIMQAWNSQLFDTIYPILEHEDSGFILNLYVQEKERKHLLPNLTYDLDNDFVMGIVLSLQNYLMKNSTFLSELKLGGKNELSIDFVKNFGQAYGVYYRIFPYIQEKRMYFYNDDHQKINSVRSLEYGLNTGVGVFVPHSIIIEGYSYMYKNNLYREVAVSDTIENSTSVSGIGIKIYHESLDDYTFPSNGSKILAKLIMSQKGIISDQSIKRIKLEYAIYYPHNRKFSTQLGVNLGSHFQYKANTGSEPFFLGGLDNFAGLPLYEKSSSFFELIQAGIVYKPWKSWFINLKLQALNYTDKKTLFPENGFEVGSVFEIGYKSFLGPVKAALAVSENYPLQLHLAVGYNNDLFNFSRR
jgi:NTE family protein